MHHNVPLFISASSHRNSPCTATCSMHAPHLRTDPVARGCSTTAWHIATRVAESESVLSGYSPAAHSHTVTHGQRDKTVSVNAARSSCVHLDARALLRLQCTALAQHSDADGHMLMAGARRSKRGGQRRRGSL